MRFAQVIGMCGALGERLLQCGEQGAVLLVNRRDAAVGAVVGGDLFEALIRDTAVSGHVAQERDDVLLPLVPPKEERITRS